MTALDVFKRYKDADREIEGLEERIERRRALAEGNGSPKLDANGGGRGSRDASMRLLDYVGDLTELETKLARRKQLKGEDRLCCLYLAEQLEERYGKAMLLTYVEGMGLKETATRMGYSLSQVKRIRQTAEDMCRKIEILVWDREHVPLIGYKD